MFEPGDNCHLHTGTIISRGPHSQHPTLPVQHVLHTYNQHLPHSATMAHQGGMAQTPHRYRLVRQYSNDALAPTSSQMSGGVTKAWPGMGSVSTQSSPTHLALQPAYSSPHVYSSQANIYAEVETDYEMDSGFTEESVSDSLGDKKEDSVYNNYTNSSCSSEAGPYLREVAHSQVDICFPSKLCLKSLHFWCNSFSLLLGVCHFNASINLFIGLTKTTLSCSSCLMPQFFTNIYC